MYVVDGQFSVEGLFPGPCTNVTDRQSSRRPERSVHKTISADRRLQSLTERGQKRDGAMTPQNSNRRSVQPSVMI